MSTLGFPTYRIYIPELSWNQKIYFDKFKVYEVEKKFIENTLLRLNKASIEDIKKCASLLEPLTNTPNDYYSFKYSFSTSKSFLNIFIDESAHFRQFDKLTYLLGMLFFRTGNYEKSYKYLDIYIKEYGKELGNLDYYSCVLLYLRLKTDKMSEKEINAILKNIFGEKLSQEVINDLSKPEDCFKYFTLPECGECTGCPIKQECKYEKWNEINTKIIQKIESNPINQEGISNIFTEIIPALKN